MIKIAFKAFGLIDIWKELQLTKEITHTDYFFVFWKELYWVEECEIEGVDVSDHCAVYLSKTGEKEIVEINGGNFK